MEQKYKTKNFYLTAFLIAKGFELQGVDRTDGPNRIDFIFEKSDKLYRMAEIFRFHEQTEIDAQLFIRALKKLKSYIYDGVDKA